MKNALRILSLLLTLIMCLGVFAACGSKKKTQNTETVDTPDDGWWSEYDFKDATIKFLVCDGDSATGELPSRSIWVDPEGDLSFEVNSAVNDRNTFVEDAIGVKIEMETCDQGGTSARITPNLSIGMHEFDVVGAYQYYDLGLTIGENGGMFVNYESETYAKDIKVNVDNPWWDKELYDILSYGGCSFWLSGDLSQPWIASVFVSFVNGEMWNTYKERIAALPEAQGISDPFELVNKGLWTLDLWSEISKTVYVDSNSNEKVDLDDTIGFLTYGDSLSNIMADGLAAGSKIKYSQRTDDGSWEMAFDNQMTGLFATKINKLYTESNACLMSTGSEDSLYLMEEFASGKGLMTVNQLHMSELYLSDMQNFLVLPVPKMLATEKYSTTNHDNVTLFGIPITTATEGKLLAATVTLELMAEKSYELVTPAYYENALKTRYNHSDDLDAQGKMIDTIRESVYHDFAALYADLIGKAGSSSVTWFFRQNCMKDSVKTQLTKMNGSWASGLESVLEDIEAAYFMEIV